MAFRLREDAGAWFLPGRLGAYIQQGAERIVGSFNHLGTGLHLLLTYLQVNQAGGEIDWLRLASARIGRLGSWVFHINTGDIAGGLINPLLTVLYAAQPRIKGATGRNLHGNAPDWEICLI
jgi:hypothetical protein